MGLAGAGIKQTKKKGAKRSSGRQAVLSKAMQVVDEETRREVRDARLEALEADNYVENAGEEMDEAYVDSEEEGRPKAKREAKRKRSMVQRQQMANKLM
ncbi:hypothetical protein NSK_002916 [Nannochloropsis salina CCMP1776]|uniref:Uncharacterized protein n=1 Tax=Nannochloropsis salina CCMP1776 TaxID=1027361 RepID=A0A4D9D3W8_9STRA|nr:hypothetical protein NSK_002916 [Nannochloropsis salina CCMP1776]|eukprot:TFJ86096.1 hypothetical protein NSK_002916 [Nannochloropsis salina CCMP1776]